jgi:hypothetical protein
MPERTHTPRVVELAPARSLGARVGRELRRHRTAYAVLAAFVVASPFVVPMIFPEASPWMGLAGGIALGIWAAACAVPDKFLGSD